MADEKIYSALILDDQIINVRALQSALKVRGFVAWGTTNQEEAIRLVEAHRPSVACIDLEMPRINGIQVITKMREIMPDIRVIVVTGYLNNYREQVQSLNVRVVEKSSAYQTNRELEAMIGEELALSKQDLLGLKNRKVPESNLRILFVDDEPEVADFSVELARAEGAEAEPAHSPEEALKIAKLFKPNVLCTDLKMQLMDGDALIKKMKASTDYSSIKVFTGLTSFFHEKDRLLGVGACEVLTKPVNLDDFIAAIRRWGNLIQV
ncbi:MAG TPA: response regulator [Candidatus Omnitrophota bacterium]|nr:response regulator [Candidatus Omnitrophota bacterium]